jgi:hypothetical protein
VPKLLRGSTALRMQTNAMRSEDQQRTGKLATQGPSRRPLYSRYKWSELTDPEKDAMRDALGIVGARAAVGLGVVSTAAAGIASGLSRLLGTSAPGVCAVE